MAYFMKTGAATIVDGRNVASYRATHDFENPVMPEKAEGSRCTVRDAQNVIHVLEYTGNQEDTNDVTSWTGWVEITV